MINRETKLPITVKLNLVRYEQSDFDSVIITEEVLEQHPELRKMMNESKWYSFLNYIESNDFESVPDDTRRDYYGTEMIDGYGDHFFQHFE